LEKPSWAPVIFSGALPREFSDLLAIAIIGLASIQLVFSQVRPFSRIDVSWILLLFVPPTAALAALSNSSNREREELALFAYGGSTTQIAIRYFLRGSIMTTVGLVPLAILLLTASLSISPGFIILITIVLIGGLAYATPALRRIRSSNFVEHYKG